MQFQVAGFTVNLKVFFCILMSASGLFRLLKGAAIKKSSVYFIILVLIYTSYNLINIFDAEHLAPFFKNMALCIWPAVISGLIIPSSERRLKSFLIFWLMLLLLLFVINVTSAGVNFSTKYYNVIFHLPFTTTVLPPDFYLSNGRMLGLLPMLTLVWYYKATCKYNLIIVIFLVANIILLGLSQARMSFLIVICFTLISIPISRNLSGPNHAEKATHLLLGIGFMFSLFLILYDHVFIFTKLAFILNAYDLNTLARMNAIDLSIWMFKENPVFGYGFGGYEALDAYMQYPHNIILDLLCEQGIVGSGIFFTFLIYPLCTIFKTQKQIINEYCIYMITFTIYYFFCTLTSGATLSQRYLWLGLALLWGQCANTASLEKLAPGKPLMWPHVKEESK